MKIAIGSDEAGFAMKGLLLGYLTARGHTVSDFGCHDEKPVLYPDVAVAVAGSVAAGENERGLLICGTGIGMCIAANKVPGIRAAVCHDPYSAQRARKSNDAQILCLGARVIGPELAKMLVDAWLEAEFQGGGSSAKVARISDYEKQFRHCEKL